MEKETFQFFKHCKGQSAVLVCTQTMTRAGARRKIDRLDLAYGASVHTFKVIKK